MVDPLDRITQAALALRERFFAAPAEAPRWLVISRFGFEFLGRGQERVPLRDLRGFSTLGVEGFVERRRLGEVMALLLEQEPERARGGAGTAVDALPRAVQEALPIFAAGLLRLRGVVVLLAAAALCESLPHPRLSAVRDWLRISDEDPLREWDPTRLGPRFPDLRGLDRSAATRVVTRLLGERGETTAIAVAHRGPSGATDAELAAWSRLGGDILVEGAAAEIVAARHQGLPCVTLALILDAAQARSPADPGELAEAAETLLPKLAALLPTLLQRLDQATTPALEAGTA